MKDLTDTICALSTPPGRSGLAVVRVSGSQTLSLLRQVFRTGKSGGSVTARRATLGRIVDPRDGAAIDEAIATCFHSPHSYTGEDMCEYSLHGNPVIVNALLDCLCAMGARIAEPGEFTLRAFLNGRMDLSQAEAVRDIIDATTLYQAQVAARQISGLIAQEIRPIKELLVEVIVDLESAVEFVEEDLAAAPLESAIEKLEGIRRKLRDWVDSFHRGRLVRDGFSLAVVGKPNVGKSSLFNALLSQNRSIVTAVPGTTRDLVSEVTNIGGIPVRLLDTAGIHDSGSFIERIGMDRSRQAIADADAVLLVGDASKPLSSQDLALKEQLMGLHCFVVINKVDLPSCWSAKEKREFSGEWPCAEVSAKAMDGIEDLRSKILEHFFGATGVEQGGMMVTNLRHCRSLEAAESDLSRATAALRDGLSEEFALTDLYRGLKRFGEITGETGVEDLLTVIFSRFCIGK